MKREDLLEQEYRKLKTQAAPDLWNRIEENLKEHPERNAAMEQAAVKAENKNGNAGNKAGADAGAGAGIFRFPRRRLYGAAAAAAAVVILAAAPGVLKTDLWRSGVTTDSVMIGNGAAAGAAAEAVEEIAEEPFAATVEDAQEILEDYPEISAGAESTAGAGAVPEASIQKAAGANGGPEAGDTAGMNTDLGAESTAGAGAVPEASIQKAAESGAGPSGSSAAGTGSAEPSAVSYGQLKLAAYEPLEIPEDAVTVAEDLEYFTENALKDTQLLCQAAVEDVYLENDEAGRAARIVYRVTVEESYYHSEPSKEQPAGSVLRVVSPIIRAGSGQSHSLYQLQPGGIYVLPLTERNGEWEIVFPYAPQIQRTEDGKYLFHSGYYDLVTGSAAIVLGNQEGPNDYYYDRMFLREDDDFLSELTDLIKSQTTGRNQNDDQ